MAKGPFYAPGVYVGQVVQQGITKAANTGTFGFALTFKVLGIVDPLDQEGGSYTPHAQQYQRTMKMWITDKTVEFVTADLKSMGYEGDTFAALDPGDPQHHSFVGQTLDFYCQHEKGQDGNTYEKWALSRPNLATKLPEYTQLEPREMRQLDALFGKALKGKKATSPPQRAVVVPTSDESLGITDDDLPPF